METSVSWNLLIFSAQNSGVKRVCSLYHIALCFRVREDCHLVIVHIQVVGSREDGDQGREPRGLALSVHSVAGVLGFMGAND